MFGKLDECDKCNRCNPNGKYAITFDNDLKYGKLKFCTPSIFSNKTLFKDDIIVKRDIILKGDILNKTGHPYCPKCCKEKCDPLMKINETCFRQDCPGMEPFEWCDEDCDPLEMYFNQTTGAECIRQNCSGIVFEWCDCDFVRFDEHCLINNCTQELWCPEKKPLCTEDNFYNISSECLNNDECIAECTEGDLAISVNCDSFEENLDMERILFENTGICRNKPNQPLGDISVQVICAPNNGTIVTSATNIKCITEQIIILEIKCPNTDNCSDVCPNEYYPRFVGCGCFNNSTETLRATYNDDFGSCSTSENTANILMYLTCFPNQAKYLNDCETCSLKQISIETTICSPPDDDQTCVGMCENSNDLIIGASCYSEDSEGDFIPTNVVTSGSTIICDIDDTTDFIEVTYSCAPDNGQFIDECCGCDCDYVPLNDTCWINPCTLDEWCLPKKEKCIESKFYELINECGLNTTCTETCTDPDDRIFSVQCFATGNNIIMDQSKTDIS